MSTTAEQPDVASKQVSNRWISLFAISWLGIWLAQLTPFQLTLPEQVNDLLGLDGNNLAESQWHRSVIGFGIVSGISAIFALIAFPVAGSLSDRTTGRLGRRRPWIFSGVALFAIALVLMGFQHTWVGLAICWSLVITGFSVASSALTALISDQVPVYQRGVVSSWVSAPQALGVVIGVALVSLLGLSPVPAYLLVAVLLVLCTLPFALYLDDPPVGDHGLPSFNLRSVWDELWISPLRERDFGWTLLGRILVNIGNALGTSLLFFLLQFGLHVADPADKVLTLTLVYTVCVVIAALVSGRLSDRLRVRKPFVLGAGVLQGFAAIVIAIQPTLTSTAIAAGLLGAGFGCFLGVDQALATQVLPDAATTGKDLGIMNIAMAVPQALGPLIGAFVVAWFGGFTALYTASAIFGILGGLSVLRVRGVR